MMHCAKPLKAWANWCRLITNCFAPSRQRRTFTPISRRLFPRARGSRRSTSHCRDPAQQDVQNAFQQLYDSLTSAYWAASTIEDKDLIRGCADVVFQIRSQLTVDDIKSRSADFQQLTNSVQSVTTKLQHVQSEIDGIIHNIQIASNVVGGVTKALDVAARFIG